MTDRALFGLMERSLRRGAMVDAEFFVRQAKAAALGLERQARDHEKQARAYHERADAGAEAREKDAAQERRTWAGRFRAIVDQHSDRPSRDKAQGDDPTPQTRRKLRRDPLEGLKRSSGWHPSFNEVAHEIEEVYRALDGGLYRRAAGIWTGGTGGGGENAEYMTDRAARLYHDHYAPWEREMRQQPAAKGNAPAPLTKLDVTLMILVDGISAREIDSFYLHADYGTAQQALFEALDRYGEISGRRRKRNTIRENAG